MDTRQKLGFGSFLATVGAFGIVAGPMMGWSLFDRPWGFLLGFAFGVMGGLGAALGVSGLIDRRSGR